MSSLTRSRIVIAVVSTSVLLVTRPAVQGEQQSHDLSLAPHTVHWGYYDASVEPVLTIDSGDRVRVETMVARFRAATQCDPEMVCERPTLSAAPAFCDVRRQRNSRPLDLRAEHEPIFAAHRSSRHVDVGSQRHCLCQATSSRWELMRMP